MPPSDALHGSPDGAHLGTVARRALAGLRIYLGLIFLLAVLPKFSGDFAPRLNGFLSHVGLVEGHPFYQAFLTTTVLPHLGLFAASQGWRTPGGGQLDRRARRPPRRFSSAWC